MYACCGSRLTICEHRSSLHPREVKPIAPIQLFYVGSLGAQLENTAMPSMAVLTLVCEGMDIPVYPG